MNAPTKTDPLRSRLGREIYGLAALLAALPLIIIGTYSLYQIDSAYRAQAQSTLEQSLRSFGEMIYEKLLQSSELAERVIDERLAREDLPNAFLNYSVVAENGSTVHSTFSSENTPGLQVVGTPDRPQITLQESDTGARVFLSFNADSLTFTGELDQFRLWGDRSLYPFATEFCVLGHSFQKPVFCSAPVPAEQLLTMQESGATRGSVEWTGNDDSWRSSFWELFLPSAFEAGTLKIVGSQPRSIVNSAGSTFRQTYLPGLLLTLAFALLGAGYHARRFLAPLSSLLAVTNRFAQRDFSATADLNRGDEFQDLATALNGMGKALDRQLRAREAMSRLDQLILKGDTTEDVFRTAISEALTYLPFDVIELDITAEAGGEQIRYSIARNDDGLTKAAIDSNTCGSEHGDPVASADISSSEEVRGILCGYRSDNRKTDPTAAIHLKTLADRISMALEFNEQSTELNRRAWYDDLTGLPNREACLRKIDRAIETAEFNDHMVALLYIDLDGFKSVNDSLGHEAGDELIRLAAKRITRCVGHNGTTARLGGDEFAVILPYSKGGAEEYKSIGKFILAQLQEPFNLGNTEAFLGASIGAARFPEDGSTHSELLRKADAAMYRAKDSGRGRQVDYSRTLGIVIAKRLRLELDLNRALERDEMQLVYQPQVDLRTRMMVGAEALLRWNHSTEGLISPEEFIPIAEETNQIVTLGNWVVFNACAQFSEWRKRGIKLDQIAVNVSANQLRNADFVTHVRECLRRFDLSPDMLEIELTEGVFADTQDISASIHALKMLGVEISIDDFGTGYSSLGYLKNLEFDKVKIDRSFVQALPHDKQSASIIQAVLAMCSTLGKPVIAEGVESAQQLQYLTDAGVEYAQGYYFGQPMDPSEFELAVRSALDTTSTIVNFSRIRTQ